MSADMPKRLAERRDESALQSRAYVDAHNPLQKEMFSRGFNTCWEELAPTLNQWENAAHDSEVRVGKLTKQLNSVVEALIKVRDCNWNGTGPSGCDSHNISHPCGPCLTDIHSTKALARQALARLDALDGIKKDESDAV